MKRPILGTILAGGLSQRMGEPKASLRLRGGATTQLEHSARLLGAFCQRVACSMREAESGAALPEGVEAIYDSEEAKGPMAGALAALAAADPWPALVLACDMPYVDAALLLQLVSRRDPDKEATAFFGADGSPEPLLAIYEARALAPMREQARSGRHSLRGFLQTRRVELIELVRPDLLASVNTPEAAAEARRRLSS